MRKINNYLKNISLFLIILLPIGLLVGSGVSLTIEILITIFFLIICFNTKKFYFFKNNFFWLLFLVWIILLLNLLLSENILISFNRNFFFFKNIILIFAIVFFLKKEKNLNLIFIVYSIITIIVTFDIFWEYINGKNILGFNSSDPTRISSFLGDELKIGHFILGFSFISIGFYLDKYYQKKSNNYKIFSFILIFFFFISLLLTGERANSMRGAFIMTLFFILSRNSIFQHKKIFVMIIILLSICVYFFSEKIKLRFDVILDPTKNIGVLEAFRETQHAAHYYTAISIFKKYPFFGIGNKNFRFECSKDEYKNDAYKRTSERCSTHPHQIYFEFLSEHGLFGTITIMSVFLFILFKSFKIYLKNKNSVHLASILYISSQFLPFIPSGSFFTSWSASIFWLNFAILILYNKKHR
jgi:O-antigen ligase